MKFKPIFLSSLVLMFAFLGSLEIKGDELFIASGRKLSNSQRNYIEDRVKKLRDSDYSTRFDAIRYLVGLDRTALPFLFDLVERGSNPTPVRCAILALSEINSPEVAPILSRVASDSKTHDDELLIVALGLGKLDDPVDLQPVRDLIQTGKKRQIRKAAALALARKQDRESVPALLKIAKSEREDELASLFLLCATMIGGEEVIKAMPRLFKSADLDRRRALVLGAALLRDPALLPTLLKYTRKDKHLEDLLPVCLGAFSSPEVAAYLKRIISGANPDSAIDAIYASLAQSDKLAWENIEAALNPARSPQVRAHALLAMVERDCTDRYLPLIVDALKDRRPEVRCAAVMAMLKSNSPEKAARLMEALKIEKQTEVIHDLLVSLGLTGGMQAIVPIQKYSKPAKGKKRKSDKGDLSATAQTVIRVIEGKTDPRVLEDKFDARLKQLTVGWGARYEARMMKEIYHWMGLDRIIQKNTNTDDLSSGDTQSGDSSQSSGDSEGTGDSGSSDQVGSITESGGSTSSQTTSSSSSDDLTSQKKFLFRREVVEWDMLMWFEYYPYFPRELFGVAR